jgi:hypothetical protein
LKNVSEWTRAGVPALFRCGADGHSDCVPCQSQTLVRVPLTKCQISEITAMIKSR